MNRLKAFHQAGGAGRRQNLSFSNQNKDVWRRGYAPSSENGFVGTMVVFSFQVLLIIFLLFWNMCNIHVSSNAIAVSIQFPRSFLPTYIFLRTSLALFVCCMNCMDCIYTVVHCCATVTWAERQCDSVTICHCAK